MLMQEWNATLAKLLKCYLPYLVTLKKGGRLGRPASSESDTAHTSRQPDKHKGYHLHDLLPAALSLAAL